MPELQPFPALRYDPSTVGDLGAVLCPPYDIISPDERANLARNEHNAVHLELPLAEPSEDRYAKAARRLADWRAGGVLRLDDRPMLYIYEQSYRLPGAQPGEAERVARGLFCRLHLEDFGRGVLRHERTMSAPKEDRFQLLSATQANLSPVLLLYSARRTGRGSAELLERLTRDQPAADVTAVGGRHRLWAVDPSRSADAAELLELASAGPLVIADGHHRYETALRYRDEVGGPGSDYMLALVFDAEAGGLSVLPTHRLLRGVAETESLLAGLQELFEVHPQPSLDALLAAMGGGGIGFWTRHGGALLSPRPGAIDPLLPAGSEALRRLDVTVLAGVLQRLLGLTAAELDEQGRLVYTKDPGEAVARVNSGTADACFLLGATPVHAVLEVAGAGELMPPKSTYFVPKAATGLLFNLLSA